MSYAVYGKKHEVRDTVDYMDKWAKDLDEQLLAHILTTKELEAISKGKELYLSAKEVGKRFKKLVTKRNK